MDDLLIWFLTQYKRTVEYVSKNLRFLPDIVLQCTMLLSSENVFHLHIHPNWHSIFSHTLAQLISFFLSFLSAANFLIYVLDLYMLNLHFLPDIVLQCTLLLSSENVFHYINSIISFLSQKN